MNTVEIIALTLPMFFYTPDDLFSTKGGRRQLLGLDNGPPGGYIEVIEDGGHPYYPPPDPVATPEPATVILLGSGMVVPIIYARTRRKQS